MRTNISDFSSGKLQLFRIKLSSSFAEMWDGTRWHYFLPHNWTGTWTSKICNRMRPAMCEFQSTLWCTLSWLGQLATFLPISLSDLGSIWNSSKLCSGLQSAVQLSSIKRNIHTNITAASHGQFVSNIWDLSCKLRNNLFQISHLKIISEDFQSGRSSDYQSRLL